MDTSQWKDIYMVRKKWDLLVQQTERTNSQNLRKLVTQICTSELLLAITG